MMEETNNGDINYYKETNELNDLNRNGRNNNYRQPTKTAVQQPSSTDITRQKQVSKNQDYLKNNNAVEKKLVLKPYTTTRIKARNFLSNIAYNSVIDQDISTKNFCFDTYVLVTKNLNLLSLERKITGQSKHEAIFMLWKNCMPKNVSWCLLQQRTVQFRFEKQISNKT